MPAAFFMQTVSALSLASVFGMISPKINKIIVKNIVDMPAPIAPKYDVKISVPMVDAAMLTMLFPIKIPVKTLLYSSLSLTTLSARLFPSAANFFILILL